MMEWIKLFEFTHSFWFSCCCFFSLSPILFSDRMLGLVLDDFVFFFSFISCYRLSSIR
jgi:membrane-bound metal-dependent hydrolase YbcI (DUF457 family)